VRRPIAATLAREHLRELIKLEREELVRLRAIYERARVEILGRLTDIEPDRFMGQHLRSALVVIETGIRVMVKKLKFDFDGKLDALLKTGIEQTLKEIAAFESRFREAEGSIQLAALREIARPRGLLLSQFGHSVDSFGSVLIRDVQFRLGVGLAKRAEVDRSYARCMRILLDGPGYPMLATHDPRLIKIAAWRSGATGARWCSTSRAG